MSISIPAGAKCLTPKLTAAKLSKQKSWLWDKVKNCPDFPKPIYLGPSPVFLERELDAYIAAQAALRDIPVSVGERLKQKAARQASRDGSAVKKAA